MKYSVYFRAVKRTVQDTIDCSEVTAFIGIFTFEGTLLVFDNTL